MTIESKLPITVSQPETLNIKPNTNPEKNKLQQLYEKINNFIVNNKILTLTALSFAALTSITTAFFAMPLLTTTMTAITGFATIVTISALVRSRLNKCSETNLTQVKQEQSILIDQSLKSDLNQEAPTEQELKKDINLEENNCIQAKQKEPILIEQPCKTNLTQKNQDEQGFYNYSFTEISVSIIPETPAQSNTLELPASSSSKQAIPQSTSETKYVFKDETGLYEELSDIINDKVNDPKPKLKKIFKSLPEDFKFTTINSRILKPLILLDLSCTKYLSKPDDYVNMVSSSIALNLKLSDEKKINALKALILLENSSTSPNASVLTELNSFITNLQ